METQKHVNTETRKHRNTETHTDSDKNAKTQL